MQMFEKETKTQSRGKGKGYNYLIRMTHEEYNTLNGHAIILTQEEYQELIDHTNNVAPNDPSQEKLNLELLQEYNTRIDNKDHEIQQLHHDVANLHQEKEKLQQENMNIKQHATFTCSKMYEYITDIKNLSWYNKLFGNKQDGIIQEAKKTLEHETLTSNKSTYVLEKAKD
jgi:hypothetical protein